MRQSVRVSLIVLFIASLFGTLAKASGDPNGNTPPQTDNASVNVIFDEEFVNASGTTPPSGWSTLVLAGNPADLWRFDNQKSRALANPLVAPAAIVDYEGPGTREVVLQSPLFNAQGSEDLILSFNHRFVSTDSSATAKVDVYDGFSWTEVFSVNTTTPAIRRESFSIAGAAGCTPQARFRFRWSGTQSGYWIVDNVLLVKRVVATVPSGILDVSPTNGAANLLARTSLGWTPTAPCPTGFRLSLGTDNPPTNILDGVNLGSATSYSHPAAFQYNTTYYWKVVPYNQNGIATDVTVQSFSIGDNPTVSSFPYNQNFDGTTYGWFSENSNGDPYTWELTTQNARSAPYAAIAYSSPSAVAPASDWLFTLPLRMTAGHQYKIDFWTRAANETIPEALEVTWGADQLSSRMNTAPVFRDARIINTSYQLSSALVTSPDSAGSSDQYIGWHYFSQPGSEYLLLDDVAISDLGAAPILLSSMTATRSGNGIELSWRVLSQTNNVQFEIEKAQAPSLNYQTLSGSAVAGHGTTGTAHNYSWLDNSAGTSTVYYRLKQTSVGGATYYSNPIRVDGLTSVDSQEGIAKQFMLGQNYPNPFNPETKISFSAETYGHASLQVYNVLGQQVATLFDGIAESGKLYTVSFNGSRLPSGVYFYRLQSGGTSAVRRLLLLK